MLDSLPKTGPYQARVKRTTPKDVDRRKLPSLGPGMIMVSLDSPKFTQPRTAAMIEWLAKRFSHITLLVCDTPHRITLELAEDRDPESAVREAIRRGTDFVSANYDSIMEALRSGVQVEVVQASSLINHDSYRTHLEALRRIAGDSPPFARAIHWAASEYHDRRARGDHAELDESTRGYRVERSEHYFTEELALLAALAENRGWVIFYPGEWFRPMVEIAEGRHAAAAARFKHMPTLVRFALKRRAAPDVATPTATQRSAVGQ